MNGRLVWVQLAALALSLAVLWYVDWLLPNVHLGPVAALPLLILAYRTGPRVAMFVAAVAAIGFAVADAGIGGRDTVVDLIVDSVTLFVAFGIVALLADRWRSGERQVAVLRKRVEREKHRAEHDAMTRLANRATFDRRLGDAVGYARRAGGALGILFVDIDRFKQVNDRFGHAAGDAVLQEVARRLSAQVRVTDVVARIGGDEFAVIVQPVTTGADVVALRDRLLASIAIPVPVAGGAVPVRISVGYGLFPEDGDDLSSLIQIADRRMYEEKSSAGARGADVPA